MYKVSNWFLLLILMGCQVGPRYRQPEVEFSPQYDNQIEDGQMTVDLNQWWKQFNDPILDEMIGEAIGGNLSLKIAFQRIEEVRARYRFEAANLWPEIDLNGSVTRSRVSQSLFETPFSGPPNQNLFQIGFDASWEIDIFGRLRSLKEAAYHEMEASKEEMRDVYITLIAEIARNYTLLRSLQAQIQTLSDEIKALEGLTYLADIRFQAGLASEQQPLDVQAQTETLKAEISPLEVAVQQTIYRLAVLVGKQPEQAALKWLKTGPILQARGKIPLGLPSDLLRRRPDIRRAERKIAAASARVRAAIAQYFPTFSLTGSFGFESDSAGDWISKKSSDWSIGPSVFWPIIDFGRIRANVSFQKATDKEAILNYEETILTALEDVESRLIAYMKESIRFSNLERKVETLKKQLILNLDLYQAGLASLSLYLESQAKLLAAIREKVGSEQAVSTNLIAVYKSLGGDWECSPTP